MCIMVDIIWKIVAGWNQFSLAWYLCVNNKGSDELCHHVDLEAWIFNISRWGMEKGRRWWVDKLRFLSLDFFDGTMTLCTRKVIVIICRCKSSQIFTGQIWAAASCLRNHWKLHYIPHDSSLQALIERAVMLADTERRNGLVPWGRVIAAVHSHQTRLNTDWTIISCNDGL